MFFSFCLCFHFSCGGVYRLGSCVGIAAGAWAYSGWLPLWEPIRRQLPDALCFHPAAPQHWIHSSQWEEDSGSNQHMDQSGLPQVWPLSLSFGLLWVSKVNLAYWHVWCMLWCVFFVSSGPDDEAKLFLWWHKALNLSAEQLQPQSGQTEVSGVVMGLLRLQTRLLQLGEERLNSGLLGAIGLGKRSPVSNRYAHMHFVS